ncbi:MAG: alginate lyase family protein [Alphaproteobacteria bacterium]|nr:alginate lyase family protein [Alphaproteobacteria bacterium]
MSDKALDSLALQLRVLMQRRERHLLANHYLANAKALVFAGIFFNGSEAQQWLSTGLKIYKQQLGEQILADGGHFERSAMYHSIILEDLLDIKNINAPLELDDVIARMVNWLNIMTGPDGMISLFNDAAFGIALAPAVLNDYAAAMGIHGIMPDSSCDLPESGYARLVSGKWILLVDAAPIGPDYQPGHAHADTLTFELWHDNARIISDTGTVQYKDSDIRSYQRSSAAHNILLVNGRDSSETWGAHRVGRRAKIIKREFSQSALIAVHDGYAPVLHQRKWEVRQSEVIISDFVNNADGEQIDVFFHIVPGSTVELNENTAVIQVGGQTFELAITGDGSSTLVNNECSFYFGKKEIHPVVKFRAKGVKIVTRIRRLEVACQ